MQHIQIQTHVTKKLLKVHYKLKVPPIHVLKSANVKQSRNTAGEAVW